MQEQKRRKDEALAKQKQEEAIEEERLKKERDEIERKYKEE
jgi:hypothetical protein